MKLHEFAQGRLPRVDHPASNVNRWLLETCQMCGRSEVFPLLTWEFSEELRAEGGECITYYEGQRVASAHIRLSSGYWRDHPDEHRKNLVIHEACHAIANYLGGFDQGHNENWGKLMRRCGQPVRLSCF